MALTDYREAVANLLEIIDAQGGYMSPRHQAYVRAARSLLLRGMEAPVPMTTVRCNTESCPSRLALVGELNFDAASATAQGMGWFVTGDVHLCPSCRS